MECCLDNIIVSEQLLNNSFACRIEISEKVVTVDHEATVR